jgi:AraC-like DNA-binding protein
MISLTQATVSTIGQQLGHASDSAFRHAFKRLLDRSPLQ